MPQPRLIDLYAQESGEAFDRVVDLLLGTESAACPADERASRLQQALRLLHGAKGGALVVDGLGPAAELIHLLEARLGGASPEAPLPSELLDAALLAIDVCRALVAAAVRGVTAEVDLPGARAALGGEAPAEAEAARAAPAPAPIQEAPRAEAPRAEAPAPEGPEAEGRLVRARAGEARPEPGDALAPGAETVRVSLSDLDALLRSLAELSACQAGLTRRLEQLDELAASAREVARVAGGVDEEAVARHRAAIERLARGLRGDEHRLARVARDARSGVAHMRMQPFSAAFEPLRRAVRDVARRTGKAARLVTEGGDVLVDKRALDALKAPLLHLVRNGVDHGLEPPEERARAGKPAEGRLRVAASRRGDRVQITVEDDGRGLDPAALRARAAELGLAAGPEVPLAALLGHPGLSTRRAADEVSGRGLGVADVRAAAERIGGRLEVETAPGRGARFSLALPLEVAARKGLLVTAGGREAYLPVAGVLRLVRAAPEDVVSIDDHPALRLSGGAPAPIVRLADLLGGAAEEAPRPTFVILDTPEGRCAVQVDRVEAQDELLLQPLRYPIARLRALEGLVVRDDGVVVPVIDTRGLLRAGRSRAGEGGPSRTRRTTPRILIADDSITTRTLERNVLEGAGMEVQLASDGQEALDLIAAGRTFDLVISDIEMPRLDGIGLVRALRRLHPREQLPIVLVTSVEQDAVRARGMEAGADALIAKQRFDDEHLLAVVRTLLARRDGPAA